MSTEPDIMIERCVAVLKASLPEDVGELWEHFEARLRVHFRPLHTALYALYGHRYDFADQVRDLLAAALNAYLERPASLRGLDRQNESGTGWWESNKAIGGVCYVDLFAGDLAGVEARIPYFKELGITYLHLMPLFKCPAGKSDGGYAVSDYRSVNPTLGTMEDLKRLASSLRDAGISLVLDFIYNHTSDQHEWALRAKRGERKYRDYYYLFPDRRLPDQYESTLREVFPVESPGSFTYCEEMDLWVWTTFKNYQWDLNYSNPEVLQAMASEMLFLANVGVEVLRLDAVAFAWKQLGTACESLEQVYTLVEALNRVIRIAAPALLFKSEAIVHPDEVVRYISPDRCQLSYNPLLMALLWEALATRDCKLLRHSMRERFAIHPETQWVNYVRGHDDIGWTFSDEDAAAVGINGFHHRQFLNNFYTGEFEGSFAKGMPFQYNPKTSDRRICGSTASLAGLEKALAEETAVEVKLASDRILLIYSVIFSVGGIPLIYLGDELGLLNDYDYLHDELKSDDARWLQRPRFDRSTFALREKRGSPAARLFEGFQSLAAMRKRDRALCGQHTTFLETDGALFAYRREYEFARTLVLNNFSESTLSVPGYLLSEQLGATTCIDAITGEELSTSVSVTLQPYQYRWISVAAGS